MTCPACGASADPSARFCAACGTRLAQPTAPAPPAHLAAKILAARTTLEGERKQVTVLFADVKGSMDLAEGLDPEAFHLVMQRFAALLAEGVHRFEGTVTQFTGDGIMALFGAPIAHEDHAARACWAALHLRDEIRRYADELRLAQGLNFSVRMGLNSGEVVVGRIGDDLRMDWTAQGHTVGIAQRMEQLAEPGHIYMSEHTARLVAGFFRLRDLGPLAVKGASAPVRIHELEGVGPLRTRLDVSRTRGFSHFVGRAAEMAALEDALAETIRGTGRTIGVVGPAGVGKSRLCAEFLDRCRARGVGVFTGHCLAHGRTIPFLPILELVRDYFGIGEHDSDAEARRKIAGTVLLVDERFREALPVLFDFLGVGEPGTHVDPEVQQRELRATLRRLAEARSSERAAVLLVDDAHWIDAGSEDFVRSMAEWVPTTRTLIVANYRPEYEAAWVGRALHLQPLGADAAAALLHELLGRDPDVAALVDPILERTAGNPFFIEEMVQALAESGALAGTRGAYRLARPVAELVLPATVQAVLAARIDRLAEREKELLQTAAVIGREIAEPVLRRVAALPASELEASLAALEMGDFVRPTALYPEAEWTFKHPLTQEVAYRSQLADRRRRVHAAVASAIEEVRAGKLDEHSALLAHHRAAAGEPFAAARWHARAAQWLGARDRLQTVAHWRAACALVDRPESEEELQLAVEARAQVIYNSRSAPDLDDEALARLFDEGRALATRLGRPAAAIPLLTSRGLACWHAGEIDAAVALCEEALALTHPGSPRHDLIRASGPLYTVLVTAGRLRGLRDMGPRLIAVLPDDPAYGAEFFGFSPVAIMNSGEALRLALEGRLADALRAVDRALAIGVPRHDREVVLAAHRVALTIAEVRGDTGSAFQHARAVATLGAPGANPGVRVWSGMTMGCALLLAGRPAEAVDPLRDALGVARERQLLRFIEPIMLARLADALRGAGRTEEALATAREAVAVARRHSQTWTAVALLAQARALDAPADVAAAVDEAEALIAESGARLYEPALHVERARLAPDDARRERELAEARRLLAAMAG